MERIYINNSEFMEFVDDLASDYVQLKYGKSACIEIKDGLSKNTCIVFTEKAQDYYSEIYYKIEKNINSLLNIYSEVDKQN